MKKIWVIMVSLIVCSSASAFPIICNEVLTSQSSLCGVKIKDLEDVNKVCFTPPDKINVYPYSTTFIITDGAQERIVAGIRSGGLTALDGGSVVYNALIMPSHRHVKIVTPTDGEVVNDDTCLLYLNIDFESTEQYQSEQKFHVCEGAYENRDEHSEKRCRSMN